jgi:hypothetical protein
MTAMLSPGDTQADLSFLGLLRKEPELNMMSFTIPSNSQTWLNMRFLKITFRLEKVRDQGRFLPCTAMHNFLISARVVSEQTAAQAKHY